MLVARCTAGLLSPGANSTAFSFGMDSEGDAVVDSTELNATGSHIKRRRRQKSPTHATSSPKSLGRSRILAHSSSSMRTAPVSTAASSEQQQQPHNKQMDSEAEHVSPSAHSIAGVCP